MKHTDFLKLLLLVIFGITGAFGFPPWGLTPLTLIAVAGLGLIIASAPPFRAAFHSWVMFSAQNFVALNWISEAFLVVYPEMGLIAFAPVFCLSAGLAIIPSLLIYAWGRLWPKNRTTLTASMLGLALFLSCAEWLTGHVLTGFPWAITALAASEIKLSQSAATFGAYGVGLLLLAPSLTFAGSFWDFLKNKRLPFGDVALVGLTVILISGSWISHSHPAPQLDTNNTWPVIRLVQANTPQREKWKPENREIIFARHLALSEAPATDRLAAIIWPETATPFRVTEEATLLARIAEVAKAHQGYVLLGTPTRASNTSGLRGYNNSLIAVDSGGDISLRYNKAHLVPGGEYVPFQNYLPLEKLVENRGSFIPGPGLQTFRLSNLPPFSPLICYEIIFPGEVVLKKDRPDWIINITNDAWYGNSAGPYQHLAISRLRAIEEGLPLVRVANTGISAAFDGKGRELGRIPLETTGFIDVALPPPEKPTLYSKFGDRIYLMLLLGLAIPSLGSGMFRRS